MNESAISNVVVVGAGVLGSALAWRLAEAGHQVTLVDPAPGGQASPGSFAWLNASFAEDPVYNQLRHDSLEIWADMKANDRSVPIDFPGAILFEQEHFDLDAIAESQAALGRPFERLDGTAVQAREPAVTVPPKDALHMVGDGYGDPVEITGWFLEAAKAAGAKLVAAKVDAVRLSGGQVAGVVAGGQQIEADQVILATGVDVGSMLAKLDLRFAMDNQPGLLAKTSAATSQTHGMLATPGVHCWQRPDGGFLIGASFGGDTEALNAAERKAASVLSALKGAIAGTDACEIEDVTVRVRPMPADGRPAIGPMGPQGLYVVCTHSGMTLAPVIAQMVASEIGGTPDARLSPYRPDRDALTAVKP